MNPVRVNVGGTEYAFSPVLIADESCKKLREIVNSTAIKSKEQDAAVAFIDRDAIQFRLILMYLRGGRAFLRHLHETERHALIEECGFYGLEPLHKLLVDVPPIDEKLWGETRDALLTLVGKIYPAGGVMSQTFETFITQRFDSDTVKRMFPRDMSDQERDSARVCRNTPVHRLGLCAHDR